MDAELALRVFAFPWMRTWRAIPETLLFTCFAVITGTSGAVVLLGWHAIGPTHLDWLHGDPTVYQAGWEFLRHASWSFPPTWIGNLDYPFGISASYLDVIPLVAIPLRLASAELPIDFQYLGIWVTLCCVLQAYFGCKLLSLFTEDRIVILLGAIFFLDAPIFVFRLLGHFSLSSQWLLLAAFYYYFRPAGHRGLVGYILPFAILLVIACGITPYLAVMVLLIGLCALLRFRPAAPLSRLRTASLETEAPDRGAQISLGQTLLQRLSSSTSAWGAASLTGLTAASFVLFGFLTRGSDFPDHGYMEFSMNLLSPINPYMSSLFNTSFNVMYGQAYEGYNYLGAGVILAGLVCLARRPAMVAKLWEPPLRPLLFASILLAILALSARITLGQTVLFSLPLPLPILNLLAIFRSSGRFFWPVHYLLVLGAIMGTVLAFPDLRARRAVLAVMLLLQYADTFALRSAVAQQSRTTWQNPLSAHDWSTIGLSHKHLIVLPARQCDAAQTPGGNDAWPWFARLAARGGMTLNSVHAARSSAASDAFNCAELPKRLVQSGPEKDSAYVLGDRLALMLVNRFPGAHYCRRVDGFNLCTFDPSRAARSPLLEREIERIQHVQ